MLRLNRRQREALGYALRELANFTAAALILGQIVAERPRWWLIVAGIATWLAVVGVALMLEGEQRWKVPS